MIGKSLRKIWKKDIIPNWSDHWDYKKVQPKGQLVELRKQHRIIKEKAFQKSWGQFFSKWFCWCQKSKDKKR